jgi:hypothetical protein
MAFRPDLVLWINHVVVISGKPLRNAGAFLFMIQGVEINRKIGYFLVYLNSGKLNVQRLNGFFQSFNSSLYNVYESSILVFIGNA